MVKYQLKISARFENVESLSLVEDIDTRFFMRIKCTQCGEFSDGGDGGSVYFDGQVHPTGSGQEANYVAHCKFCRRLITLSIVPKSSKPYVHEEDSDPKFTTVIEFEARGGEPSDFEFHGSAWKAKVAESSTQFVDLDFSAPERDGVDWVEFDNATSKSVGIYNLQAKFLASK